MKILKRAQELAGETREASAIVILVTDDGDLRLLMENVDRLEAVGALEMAKHAIASDAVDFGEEEEGEDVFSGRVH